MGTIDITTVRHTQQEGADLLRAFIFGGFRSGPRVPRGIEPGVVAEVIRDDIPADAPAMVFRKTVAVLRFYETVEALPSLSGALQTPPQDVEDIRRCAYVIQAVGDLADRERVDEVADTFDSTLAAHPRALDAVDLLLETLVVLAPSGSPDRLVKRIDGEVESRARHRGDSEEGLRAYLRAADVQRLQLPQTQLCIEEKVRLVPLEADERRPTLVEIYMGRAPVSDDLMITWAGRMLRREAMTGDPAPIHAAFAAEIDQADPEALGKDAMTDTQVARAAQAILYLGGRLSNKQRERYEKTTSPAMSFLWDDLPL